MEIPLTEAKMDKIYYVSKVVFDKGDFYVQILMEHGIIPKTEIMITRKENPYIVISGESRIAISENLVGRIFVEEDKHL